MNIICIVLSVSCYQIVSGLGTRVSNLNSSCFRCLCHVAGCDTSHTCTDGYCGPFWISKLYWIDSGKVTLPEDDPQRDEGLRDCMALVPIGKEKTWTVNDDKTIFNISEIFSAYEDCARDYYCSIKIVENYMTKYGKDCNGDGVTDCYDYMMINYHGGGACSAPLFLTASGRKRLKLFQECKFS